MLRDDILKVGSWSMRYSNAAFNAPKDLQPLVDVNNDMIEGLSANTKPPVLTTTSSAYAGTTGQSSLELVG